MLFTNMEKLVEAVREACEGLYMPLTKAAAHQMRKSVDPEGHLPIWEMEVLPESSGEEWERQGDGSWRVTTQTFAKEVRVLAARKQGVTAKKFCWSSGGWWDSDVVECAESNTPPIGAWVLDWGDTEWHQKEEEVA